jgi:UDP-hydrolysing UDP-N-acetyl-D-glucosamine 2-epimerase
MNKIDFITLSRSDYASLSPIYAYFKEQRYFNANLIFGGSHCLKRFGHSKDKIQVEFPEALCMLDFLHSDKDLPSDLTEASGRLVTQMHNYLRNSKPDAVFIVGDRWELLPVAYTCFLNRIPVLHHSGGDMTQGSMDNQTRYALTNLSNLHFVGLEKHRDRLLSVGEEPWRVSVVGEPALNQATRTAHFISEEHNHHKVEHTLATFHPCLGDSLNIPEQTDFFLNCLREIPGKIIITGPNPDAYSSIVFDKIQNFNRKHSNVVFEENLGSAYYEVLAKATLLIGNSSSGIWETATFRVPTINIGLRQEGRTRQSHVIDILYEISSFRRAMAQIKSKKYIDEIANLENIYYDKSGLSNIHKATKENIMKNNLINKKMLL